MISILQPEMSLLYVGVFGYKTGVGEGRAGQGGGVCGVSKTTELAVGWAGEKDGLN